MTHPGNERSQPAINAPTVVMVLVLIFVGLHVWQMFMSDTERITFILTYAFIPARYLETTAGAGEYPGGAAGQVWTFVSYAFLHADWMHLLVNSFWMLAFGSVVARRLKTAGFLAFSALCAIGGAAIHLAFYWGEPVPMIGASAAISGQMAGAVRFIFARPGNLFQTSRMHAEHMRAQSLSEVLTNPRALIFLAVWVGINVFFGLTSTSLIGQQVAWEAHLGGFLVGLVLFGLFDRFASRSTH